MNLTKKSFVVLIPFILTGFFIIYDNLKTSGYFGFDKVYSQNNIKLADILCQKALDCNYIKLNDKRHCMSKTLNGSQHGPDLSAKDLEITWYVLDQSGCDVLQKIQFKAL